MSVVSTSHWSSRVDVFGGYHEYTDVKSCQDVVHLHHLLWSATILNIVALFLGIITAAVLGSFKDMVGGPPPTIIFMETAENGKPFKWG